ncbi:MAG: hypothetical protein IT200_04125 [Thermoleophilia bacterium]|nr:hypothetical protein [Thermoleophilia bacterium]
MPRPSPPTPAAEPGAPGGDGRLATILAAVKLLEADAPLDARLEALIALVARTHPSAAAGIVGDGRRHHDPGAGDATLVAAAEAAAVTAARTGTTRRARHGDWTVLAAPLRCRDRVDGALWVADRAAEVDEWLVTELAGRAAPAVATELQRVEQLEQAEALHRSDALKTTLLHGVTHELLSPLAGIANAAEALGVIQDHDERRELARAITAETQRLERVVSNLLDLSRLEGGVLQARMDWCTPEELIGAGLQAAGAILDGVPVTTEVPDDPPLLRADPVLSERILVNLLNNAVRHGTPPIHVAARREGDEVAVSVMDDGPGVHPDVLPSVFEPFIHREGVGLGLGLPLCRRLAEAQGARLEHRAGDLAGACFTLVFPLPAPPAQAT